MRLGFGLGERQLVKAMLPAAVPLSILDLFIGGLIVLPSPIC